MASKRQTDPPHPVDHTPASCEFKRPYFASEMIKILEQTIANRGDLPVYFVSEYDWGAALRSYETVPDQNEGGWDGTPQDKPYLYFGV